MKFLVECEGDSANIPNKFFVNACGYYGAGVKVDKIIYKMLGQVEYLQGSYKVSYSHIFSSFDEINVKTIKIK